MSSTPGGVLGWQRGRLLPLPQEARRQLVFFAWMRLPVVTAALVSILLVNLVGREAVQETQFTPLYVLIGCAYLLSILNLAALSYLRQPSHLALLQFGGDVLIETGLLVVLSSEEAAVAFVVALFFLTTLLACSYLNRVQGSAFATGAFLLLAVVHVLGRYEWLPVQTLRGEPPFGELTDWDLFLRLCIYVLTFCGTAWLVGLRQERLRAMGDRLRSVAGDLAQLQAFNEHVIHSMTTGLVTTDEEDRITHANAAAEALLGQDREQLRGQELHELLGWQQHAAEDAALLAEGDDAAPRLSRESRLDGRLLSLNVSTSRLRDREGHSLGRLHLLEDVTELRGLEQDLRLKEKMAAIGEMAAGIAHEIRNPLASISGSVQMLDRQLELGGDQGRLMGIVLRESQRLDSTIREFLEFARPRSARPREVDLAELARETLTLLENSDEVREHHRLEGPEREGVIARADPDQLKQVVWNLCRNALQAMPDGGTLRVDVARLDGECLLAVQDEGVGMSPEMQRRAFQPLSGDFERGIGLGLAIVYRIVKDHGGRVRFDPEVTVGTRIEVLLPSGGEGGQDESS